MIKTGLPSRPGTGLLVSDGPSNIKQKTVASDRLGTGSPVSDRPSMTAESEWGDIAMPPHSFGEANYPPSQPLDGDEGVEDTTSILEQFDTESAARESDDVKDITAHHKRKDYVTYRCTLAHNKFLPQVDLTLEQITRNPDNNEILRNYILKNFRKSKAAQDAYARLKTYIGAKKYKMFADYQWAVNDRKEAMAAAAAETRANLSSKLRHNISAKRTRRVRPLTRNVAKKAICRILQLQEEAGIGDLNFSTLDEPELSPVNHYVTQPFPGRGGGTRFDKTRADKLMSGQANSNGPRDKGRRRKTKGRLPGRHKDPIVMYGVKVPRNMHELVDFDKELDNNPALSSAMKDQRWRDCIKKQMREFHEFDTFEILPEGTTPAELKKKDYQLLPTHWVSVAKNDGTFKMRYCANGDRISTTAQSFCSMVDVKYSRLLWLIAHANGQKVLAGDVLNGYLMADNLEKVFVRCGPEFGENEGRLAIVKKALYGIGSAGHAFTEKIKDIMLALGWTPTDIDRNIWRRENLDDGLYDYCSYFIDDFVIVSKNPEKILGELEEHMRLKFAGIPEKYLGCDTVLNHENPERPITEFYMKTYLQEALRIVEDIGFQNGSRRKHKSTPIPETANPEEIAAFDYKKGMQQLRIQLRGSRTPNQDPSTSNGAAKVLEKYRELNPVNKRLYQKLMGMLQWIKTLGRFDITEAVTKLAKYQSSPKQGHLDLAVGVFAYLRCTIGYGLAMDSTPLVPDSDDYREQPEMEQMRQEIRKEYHDATEFRSLNDPVPRGKELQLSVFCDASHGDNTVDRSSVTGLVVVIGSTVIQTLSRRQGSIPSGASYGSELLAAKEACETIAGWRIALRSLGVPVTKPTWLFVDNNSVQITSTKLATACKKKHTDISYHMLRSYFAAGVINVKWVASEDNWADLCTKSLGGDSFRRHASSMMLTPHLAEPDPLPTDKEKRIRAVRYDRTHLTWSHECRRMNRVKCLWAPVIGPD
jgi:hypothetical protein